MYGIPLSHHLTRWLAYILQACCVVVVGSDMSVGVFCPSSAGTNYWGHVQDSNQNAVVPSPTRWARSEVSFALHSKAEQFIHQAYGTNRIVLPTCCSAISCDLLKQLNLAGEHVFAV